MGIFLYKCCFLCSINYLWLKHVFIFNVVNMLWCCMQIFISRDGGSKKYASVLAPGQHEGLGWGNWLMKPHSFENPFM